MKYTDLDTYTQESLFRRRLLKKGFVLVSDEKFETLAKARIKELYGVDVSCCTGNFYSYKHIVCTTNNLLSETVREKLKAEYAGEPTKLAILSQIVSVSVASIAVSSHSFTIKLVSEEAKEYDFDIRERLAEKLSLPIFCISRDYFFIRNDILSLHKAMLVAIAHIATRYYGDAVADVLSELQQEEF